MPRLSAVALLAALLSAAVPAPARADDPADTPNSSPADAPADTSTAGRPDVRVHTLDNGLTVILAPEHKAPVISFQVWYKVGSRNEQVGRTGLSHMLEHMMFKGTERYGPGEFSRIVARYGGSENAFTSRDYTAYFENWSPDHLKLSVELEADRMTGLTLDPKEFTPERQVVAEERRMRTDDKPVQATVEQMYATAFVAHPYGKPVIGWMSDILRFTRDDLEAHYRRYYAPNNATVVVVGDFDPDQALAEIRDGFGALPRAPDPPEVRAVEPEQPGERRVVVRREAQLPFIFLGYHAPNWESPDAYPLTVLGRILFEGKRSRIYQRLIYTDQSAVEGGGEYDALTTDPLLFYFYAVVAPGHDPDQVESAIYQEVERLQSEPPDARELARAKNQVEAEYVMGQDSDFYRAMRLGEAATVGAGPDWVARFPGRIREVTAEQVRDVARRYLRPDGRTVAVLIPTPAPEEGGAPAADGGGAPASTPPEGGP